MSSRFPRHSLRPRVDFALLLALCSVLLQAQEGRQSQTQDWKQDQHPGEAQPVRPSRIGVALGGGGALGIAHIGVLKWMEENRIPVDRIAGTSMGGIIGAMYASGMSAAEIEKFAETIDWDRTLLPEPTYSQLSYRRKQDRRNYQIEAALGLKHGLSGPNGFNSGNGVGLLLDRIFFAESGMASFDDLPIPFRCVAT